MHMEALDHTTAIFVVQRFRRARRWSTFGLCLANPSDPRSVQQCAMCSHALIAQSVADRADVSVTMPSARCE